MLDIKTLRSQLPQFVAALARRGFTFDAEQFDRLEQERKSLQVEVETLQARRNQQSKAIGQAKAQGRTEEAQQLMAEVQTLKTRLGSLDTQLKQLQESLQDFLLRIPNIPHSSVPDGENANNNAVVRTWGKPQDFDFVPQDHTALGQNLGQNHGLSFAEANVMTGSRFVVMHGLIARLHRALGQFMLDVHTQQHAYQEVYVPYVVHADSLVGTGQLPKFAEELFRLDTTKPYYLIPTAEVPVMNLVRDKIVAAEDLPLKFVAHTPCFRSEAGSYGKDTQGMIRQHQFDKVELVHLVRPEDAYQALEQLTEHAEVILQKLQLPYRVLSLCTGDLGFGAAKTYDIEVWLPGQDAYREISSCSNTEAFQARRLNARYRNKAGDKAHSGNNTKLLHSLNGSALAVGRTLIAIMENYQTASGEVLVPEVLQPYMHGVKLIKPE